MRIQNMNIVPAVFPQPFRFATDRTAALIKRQSSSLLKPRRTPGYAVADVQAENLIVTGRISSSNRAGF